MKLSTKPFVIIGVLLFFFIIYKIGVEKIFSVFLKLDIVLVILSMLVLIPATFLKAYKWKVIVKKFHINIGLIDATKYWLVGLFVGNFTPGRAGDFIRTFYLRKSGIGLGKSLATVVADRLFDIATLLLLSLVGVVMIFFKFGSTSLAYTIFFIFFLVSLLAIAFLKKEPMKIFLKPIFNFFVPEKHKSKSREHFHEFYNAIGELKKDRPFLFKLLFLSLLSWIVSYIQYYLIFLSFGYSVNFIYILTFLPIEVLISLIPITVSGFGTREAVYVSLFSLLGVPPEVSVSFGLVGMIFSVWSLAIVGAILSWRNPIETSL